MLSLHTAILRQTSALQDLAIAAEVGFDGVELQIGKLQAHMRRGGELAQLSAAAGALEISMLDCIIGIERADAAGRSANAALCADMAEAAKALNCPFVQIVALDAFPSVSPSRMRRQLRDVVAELAAIAVDSGVALALEPVCFSPFCALAEAVDLVGEIGIEKVKLVLDTWHLWCAGTSWDEVAALDPDMIACAQIGDCLPRSGAAWQDSDRGALPGRGVVPVVDAVAAIRATGFRERWTAEVFAGGYEGWEPQAFARAARVALAECVGDVKSETTENERP